MDRDGRHARPARELVGSKHRSGLRDGDFSQHAIDVENHKLETPMNAMSNAMSTVGLVGVGKIGLPIADNLIKSGYRVVGYRRSSLAEFEKIGGIVGRSAADVGAQADVVFSCLPSSEALEDVMQGPNGLIKSARPGQIIVELGSHPVPDKERHVGPLAAKGAIFLDGEVSGTPGMVSARKAVISLAGDKEACARAERFVRGFADSCLYFGRSAPPAV